MLTHRALIVGCFAAALWAAPGLAATDSDRELRPPLHPSASVDFNPAACQSLGMLPSVSGAHIVVGAGQRRIGPYIVPLNSFQNPGDAYDPSDAYRPILIEADPGTSLRIDIDNQLPAAPADNPLANTTNLHTHGLIVSPRPYDAAKPCPGDSVYQSVPPQAQSTSLRQYRIDIPDKIPTTLFGLGKPGDTEGHPAGVFWFHAHIHTQARPQVTDGMSGLLSIGDPFTHLRIDRDAGNGKSQVDETATAALRASTDVRYLALRDIQVDVPPCAASAPTCDRKATMPDHLEAQNLAGSDVGGGYSPGLCAQPPVNKSGKQFPGEDTTPYAPADSGFCAASVKDSNRVWLFTVNGQLMPNITLQPGRNHLWRIANLSASVTYVLDLVDVAAPNRTASETPMCVISIDGVVAGGSKSCSGQGQKARGGRFANVGIALKEVLLMPGSRAELLITNDNHTAEQKQLVLRTLGLNTGNSYSQSAGDAWPQIDLARVLMLPQIGPGFIPPPQLQANLVWTGADAAQAVSKAKSNAKAPHAPAFTFDERETLRRNPNCVFLPSGSNTFRRQIVFDEVETLNNQDTQDFGGPAYPASGGSFALGSRVVSGQIGSGDADKKIGLVPTPYGAGQDMAHMSIVAVPTGPRVCTVLGRGEIWELVNWTSETHNFHIHQGKFRLAASGDPGLPPDFKTAVIGEDASKSPVMKFFSSTADPSNDVQAWHDTLPVPPRVQIDDSHFTPGRVFVFIPFVAKEQLGSFVFHCHILEHEDQGMMADIQVVEPVSPRTAAAY